MATTKLLPAMLEVSDAGKMIRITDQATRNTLDLRAITHPHIRNLRPDNMRRWRRIKAGGVDGILLNIGDSTTRGQSGGTAPGANGANPVGEHAGSYPVQVFNRLKTAGLNVSNASYCGASSYAIAGLNAADPRIVVPSDWSLLTDSIGGASIAAGSAITSVLTFTPTEAFDTVDVYYIASASSGTLTVSVDSGSAIDTWATAANPSGFKRRTITGITLGTHTLKISRSTGSTVYPTMVVCRDSTNPKVHVVQAGWAGSRTIQWTATDATWRAISAIPVIDPDLTVINLGINDAGNLTPLDDYIANMKTIIAACRAGGGDVALIQYVETMNGATPLATQELYWKALLDLSDSQDCPLIMCRDRFGNWDQANTDGWMFDSKHPTAAGYADMATLISQALLLA